MRFKTYLQKEPKHSDLVSCVSWHTTEEVLSCSDDHTVMAWNLVTNEATKLITLPDDLYPTDMQFYPRSSTYGGTKKHGAGDIFVVTATDGKFHLINRNGRIEKSMEAHRGAVLAAQWSHDGTALVTAGEDGHVKIWSRSGMLRSTLASNSLPIYSVAWNPNSNKVLFTLGRQLVIKPLQPHLKPVQWQAHEGLILKVSWNTNNNLIVSGSEDCKYKVWDSYGGVLYVSNTSDYPITSVAWAPNGEMFAVGSFNSLRLCDQTGWSYSLDKPQTQSIFCLAWSGDGTQIAGGCGNGHVIFAHVIEKRLEWKMYEATIRGRKTIAVQNVSTDVVENLDFRDSIIQASLEHNHMIVVTSAQCFVYSIKNWNTPQVINLKEGNVTLVAQSERHFLLVDGGGLYIYSYEGRLLSSPKWPAMRPAVLNHQTLSLCSDTLAVRDKQDERMVHIFDALTGKPAGDGKPLHHLAEVLEIALDHCGPPADRKLAFVDKNKELYLAAVRTLPSNGIRVVKLGIVMQSIKWNDSSNMLAALQDGRLTIWYYPAIAYFNRRFLTHTVVINEISDFGNNPQIINFLGTHISIRRVDGSLISTTVAPYPSLLHGYVSSSRWDDALRLCRFVKDDALWACLAAMSTMAHELETAELAYAAIDEMDKVDYIQYIRNLPLKELQNSEVLLLCGNVKEAESILLHKGHIFRAIMLNLRLYKWERALELATKHGKHLEIVLASRQRYIKTLKRNKETNAQFLELMKEVEVNVDNINALIEAEYQKERNVASSSQSRES